jgi:aspartyl-tRNA(Asn)/glutamyl-tRNA(Gln) amidotransferase subunit C
MTMEIAELRRTIKLARLAVTPEKEANLLKDVGRIVDFMQTLNEVDVANVRPLSHVHDHPLRLMDDRENPDAVGRRGLLNSKGYEDGLVKVPKIIE